MNDSPSAAESTDAKEDKPAKEPVTTKDAIAEPLDDKIKTKLFQLDEGDMTSDFV